MISIKKLGKVFETDGKRTKVLKNINLCVSKAEIISIIGPSGCGKTTFLRILSGLLNQSRGTIQFREKKNGVQSFIFQKPALLEWRTVRENIELFQELEKKENQSLLKVLLTFLILKNFKTTIQAKFLEV